MTNFFKKARNTFAGVALAVGFSAAAMASPFTFVPPGSAPNTVGTEYLSVTTSSSELLTVTPTGNTTDFGYLTFDNFKSKNATYTPLSHGFGIYAIFTLTDQSVGGGTNVITALTFKLYLDPTGTNVYTVAGSVGDALVTGTPATVTGTSDDVLLGEGSLISGITQFLANNGAGINVLTTFALNSAGQALFTKPDPFFTMTSEGLNNANGGAIPNADHTIAIIAGGTTTFSNPVPEPTSIALLGLGLMGMGVAARRRRKN